MHIVSPAPVAVVVCQSAKAGLFVEATTTQDVVITYDDHEQVMPKGSVIDAPCSQEIELTDDRVIIRSGMAEWTCPFCGHENIVDLP